jgi:septal ring factor EnvC (AmiA/AmiB activator)
MENLNTIFIAITGLAVLLQAGVLLALFLAVRKTAAQMEKIADEVKTRALPAIESATTLLAEIGPKVSLVADQVIELQPKISKIAEQVVELRPKVSKLADNLADVSQVARDQAHRIDATVSDVTDRARLQVIRADEMLTRTLDRVEHTSDVVTKTVVSPVRQVSGIIQGVTAGFEFLLQHRGRKTGENGNSRRPVPQDEMFI